MISVFFFEKTKKVLKNVLTNTSKNDIIYIVNNLWLWVAGSHPVRAKVAFCFVRFSLPHKPRALCGRCKSDIKTDKTVMGFGRNNYLLNIIYHDTENRNAFGIFVKN